MKIWKFLLVIVVCVVLSFGIFVYFMFNGTPWGKSEQKQAMLSYLSDKYHEEFSIDHVSYNPLGSGYYAAASPERHPDSLFDVAVSQDTESGYADLYPSVLWNTPDAEPIKNTILQFFPNLNQSSFTVGRQLEEDVGPHIPTLRSLHYDAGYQSVLRINLMQDWYEKTPEDQQADLEKIQQIAAYLQTNHFPVLTRIYYQTDDYNNRKAIYITEKGEIVQR